MQLLVPQQMRRGAAALVADDEGASVEPHKTTERLRKFYRSSAAPRADPEHAIFEADLQRELLLAEL